MTYTETHVAYLSIETDVEELLQYKNYLDKQPFIFPYCEYGFDGYEYFLEFTTQDHDRQDAGEWADEIYDEMERAFDVLTIEFVTSGSRN